MQEIDSESKFVWHLLKTILLLPFRFIGVLFRKQESRVLTEPNRLVWQFFWQARATAWIIIILVLSFIISLFLPMAVLESMMLTQQKAFSFSLAAIFGAGFLHADIAHLVGNCMVIFAFGRVIEKELGSAKLLLIYLLGFPFAHIGGMGLDYLFYGANTVPGIGASGVMMGLVAIGIMRKPFYFTYEFIIPLPLVLVGWLSFLLDIVNLYADTGVGHAVHLAGFVGMLIIGLIFFRPEKKELIKGLIASAVSIGLLLFLILRGYL